METAQPRRSRAHLTFMAAAIIVLILAGTFAFVSAGGSNPTKAQTATSVAKVLDEAQVSLWVKAYSPSGQLIAQRNASNDLILDTFNIWFTYLLGAGSTGISCASEGAGLVDPCNAFGNTATCSGTPTVCGVLLGVGTSSTPAARSDTGLGTQFGALFADSGVNAAPTSTADPSLCHTGTTDEIYDINGTTTVGSTTTIKEAAAFIKGSYSATYTMIIFHDVFDGIAVTSGDTVTVSYQVNLANAGLTTNLCYLLAGFFTGNISATGKTVSIFMTTTSGATGGLDEQFLPWCNGGGLGKVYTVGCGSSSQGAYEGVGTGNTPFTPASYSLTTQVGAYTYPATNAYSSTLGTATMYWTSTFTIATPNTLKEGGLFMYLTLNSVSSQFMIFALTFSGQAQVADVPFGISLWVTD